VHRRSAQRAHLQVQLCSDGANFLLRMRATPQLTSLSDFQDPTPAHSVRQKKGACQKQQVCKGGARNEPTCRCRFAPIVLIFCCGCAPHHSFLSFSFSFSSSENKGNESSVSDRRNPTSCSIREDLFLSHAKACGLYIPNISYHP
jgi:hypothetical protein